ncbi:MAG TPA: hypothetical protein VFL03_10650 [Candidatus Limnocylindrales bacterium]|nr:hypothetical protein [Candidatus Limnocylindrales bacterium]
MTHGDHERALELAAVRVGESLPAADDAWLEAHLIGCPSCSQAAADFHAQRSLFASARRSFPEPPRDLWARTAGEIEAQRMPRRAGGLSRLYAPLAGAMVVAVAVGLGLLNGLPAKESTSKGDEPDATPFALTAGEVQTVVRNEDGRLELRRQPVDEVCPLAAQRCGVEPEPERTDTQLLATTAAWDAIISPSQDQVVVVERGDGAQGVYVLQVPGTTAVNPPATETPATPTVSPSEAPLESATPSPSDESTPTTAPTESPAATETPSDQPSATETPTEEPASSEPTPSDIASASPSEPAPSESPTADASPEPTPEATAEATTTPAPSVKVTPRPDGAVEIASNVRIVGTTAAYSPDGTRFAFTARPADGDHGPDVYVWTVGDARANAITDDHASVFAGWIGKRLLVSRVSGSEARTVEMTASGSRAESVYDGAMWRPTVSPDRDAGVWWDGTVRPDADGISWLPDRGRLVLRGWPAAGTAQVLADTGLTDWAVAWDEDGTKVAVWTTTGNADEPGSLSLYPVDPETGRADLDHPRLDAAAAFGGFSLRNGRLTWSAPAEAGDTTVQVLAWQGDKIGRFELPTEEGTTVVR